MADFAAALQDFRGARNRAALKELLARLTGQPIELLSYEDVRRKARATGVVSRSLTDVSLDAIVGSVGRYRDFTRGFLPRQDSDAQRWAQIKIAVSESKGLPPIDLYQIGEVYFVQDGHHRVSVARQLGEPTIQAYVTEVHSKVPLSADTSPDEMILVAEYADFLEQTSLDELRPNSDVQVSALGQYSKLLEHIEVHRYYMGVEQQREIAYSEAVAHWHDNVFLPVVETIRESGILHEFPNRTETDLYLWLAKHRADIEEQLGWQVAESTVVADLVDQYGTSLTSVATRAAKRVVDVIVPDELEPGPKPGKWRQERALGRSEDRLFGDVLVPVSGQEAGWIALEQAIIVAQHEGGRLHGLYVFGDQQEQDSSGVQDIRDRFYWRTQEVGLPADFSVEHGPIARKISERARWSDLVVVNLSHPTEDTLRSRLSSGFRTLIRRSSRPILAVPWKEVPLARPLLAYDGSPKSEEALYVASYLAARWQLPLVVVTVAELDNSAQQIQDRARLYLEEHDLQSTMMLVESLPAEAILETAAEQKSDFLIMGGYGRSQVMEIVLGAITEQILRDSLIPVLICQ